LWRELEQAWQQWQGQQRAWEMGHPVRAEIQSILSRFMIPDQAEAIFGDLAQAEVPPEPALLSLLTRVRAAWREAGVSKAATGIPASQQLFVDLLNMPDDIDPFDWLQTEHGPETALETFGDILSQCRPPRTMMVGNPIQILRPRVKLSVGKQARIRVEEVLVGSGGFTITLKVDLRGSANPAEDVSRIQWHWLGFDGVTDNQGYAYLVQHRELSVGGGLRNWSRESLRLAYYPALAAGSTSLCFTANPMVLNATGVRLTERPLELPSEQIGDLTYQIGLPAI
jgi:hypothetical protein